MNVATQAPVRQEPNEGELFRSQEYQNALRLWLQWDEAHQSVCAELYQSRHDQQRIQEMLDQLDALRRSAVMLSRQLVD